MKSKIVKLKVTGQFANGDLFEEMFDDMDPELTDAQLTRYCKNTYQSWNNGCDEDEHRKLVAIKKVVYEITQETSLKV